MGHRQARQQARSLTIKLIPLRIHLLAAVIFSGLVALGSLLTYQIVTLKSGSGEASPLLPLAVTTLLLMFAAAITGPLILRILFQPVDDLVEKASATLPTLPPSHPASGSEAKKTRHGDAAPLYRALTHVAEALEINKARSLFPDVIASTPHMRSLLALIIRIAPSEGSVLILGESGTGKELVARAIHNHSPRASQPFIAINCAGIPEGLLESELFGHEKGAFTGAHARKIGKIEAANHGSLFLDEIADMPFSLQAKILRALQEREIDRVGGTHPIPVNIRVIAATNKNLEDMVQKGAFRDDLFFRLNVFSLPLPPLRDRREDIPLIANHFLNEIKPQASLSPEAHAALIAWTWPGNIRELRNVIEAAATLAGDTNLILPNHLQLRTKQSSPFPDPYPSPPTLNPNLSLDERIAEYEKLLILDALRQTHGVQAQAAKKLGIKERSLWHRIAKHQIDVAAIKKDL
ncbi:MAG TPA: sigma 54-interacting transcriptional regulator [Kiritimatiellia bacterium]|nr:sigma 54-interacting transcriptional regulator [Kiritimatiellia bacterium]